MGTRNLRRADVTVQHSRKGKWGPIGAYWLIHTCTRTDNIYTIELFGSNMEHALQVLPVSYVCLLEDCSC